MLLLHFKEVEVDYCERCGGIWLDDGELQALMQTTGSNSTDPLLRRLNPDEAYSNVTRRLCPRCDARLQEFTLRGLALDRCPRGHGLWFDADELQQLLSVCGASKTVAFLKDLLGQTQTTAKEESQS